MEIRKKLNTLLPIMVDKANEEEKVEGLVALVVLSVIILQHKVKRSEYILKH